MGRGRPEALMTIAAWLLRLSISLLLVRLSLGTEATILAPRAVDTEGTTIRDLPIEVRDLILAHLALDDYLSLLVAFPDLSMSVYQERKLLAHAARGLEHLKSGNYDEFKAALCQLKWIQSLLGRRLREDECLAKDIPLRARSEMLMSQMEMFGGIGGCEARRIILGFFVIDPEFPRIWRLLPRSFRRRHRALVLQSAALTGNVDWFERLATGTFPPKPADLDGLIICACRTGPPAMVEVVLRRFRERSVQHQGRDGIFRAFYWAVIYDQVELLEHLGRTAEEDAAGALPELLIAALGHARPGCLEYLVARVEREREREGGRLDWSCILTLGLSRAAAHGNLEVIKWVRWEGGGGKGKIPHRLRKTLLGVDLASLEYGKVLVGAAEGGQLHVARFLLSAQQGSFFPTQQILLPYARDALARAAYAGHLDIIEYLLRIENNVPAIPVLDDFGYQLERCPLKMAAQQGHLHVVQYLLTSNEPQVAREFQRDICIQQAYLWAAFQGRLRVVKYFMRLQENGLPVFAAANRPHNNRIALGEAISQGRRGTVAFLMRMQGTRFLFPGILAACQEVNLLELAVVHKASAIVSFLLRRNEYGEYCIPHVDPAANFFYLRDVAVRGNDHRTLALLLERDEQGRFCHARGGQTAVDLALLIEALIRHQHLIVRHLLERDDRGNFCYPELQADDNFDQISRVALGTGCVENVSAVGDAFPALREKMLWSALESKSRKTISVVLAAFKKHIDRHLSDDGHQGNRLIPHPAVVAIADKNTRVLRMLLHRDAKGELMFKELFGSRTLNRLRQAARNSGNRAILKILLASRVRSKLVDDGVVRSSNSDPTKAHFVAVYRV